MKSLLPQEETLVGALGYYVDVANEDKYLIRDDGVWIGPTAATEAEIKMWMVLFMIGMRREKLRGMVNEIFDLHHKFHTEHTLNQQESERLDQLLVALQMEFNG